MTETSQSQRLLFVDQFRGLIMIFMALDHALYFWSNGGRISNEGLPLVMNGVVQFNQPDSLNPLGYLVMLLSSLAAPGFLFLSGYVLSRSLARRREKGMSSGEITRHLWKRGLTLIALQIFVASPAFNLPNFVEAKSLSVFTVGSFLSFSVLSTIGTGLIFIAIMQKFPPWVPFLTAAGLYTGEQILLPALAPIYPALSLTGKALISYFLLPVPFDPSSLINQNFPVIPWLIPITLGWLFGQTFRGELALERKRFLFTGLSFLLAFITLRFNHLGDYLPFQGTFTRFFVLSKYPPSPDYFLFYLGIMFCLFTVMISLKESPKRFTVLRNFGQVPLFFYSVHLWVYALIPLVFNRFNVLSLGKGIVVWFLGLLVLNPLSKKYLHAQQQAKRRHIPVHTH